MDTATRVQILCCILICMCMQNHNDTTIKTNSTVLRKIYLSVYLKELWVRGSWKPNRTATYWPLLLWPSAFLSRSPGLLNRGPGAQPLWVLVFSTATYVQLVWSPQNSLNFLCIELYYSSTPTQSPPITGHRNTHFYRLWNGMFDRHRAEITVMQFTGHSLPVHQFVTVPWDFNPVPYCQPSSLMPMEYALPHVWPGRRSIYYTWTRPIAFHKALIPLGNAWILLFFRLWVNSRGD